MEITQENIIIIHFKDKAQWIEVDKSIQWAKWRSGERFFPGAFDIKSGGDKCLSVSYSDENARLIKGHGAINYYNKFIYESNYKFITADDFLKSIAGKGELKMYQVHAVDNCSEEAVLAFAEDVRQAKCIGYPALNWINDFTEVRAKWLKDSEYAFLRSQQLYNVPHVIENPESCDICGKWGVSELFNGVCDNCIENGACP